RLADAIDLQTQLVGSRFRRAEQVHAELALLQRRLDQIDVLYGDVGVERLPVGYGERAAIAPEQVETRRLSLGGDQRLLEPVVPRPAGLDEPALDLCRIVHR